MKRSKRLGARSAFAISVSVIDQYHQDVSNKVPECGIGVADIVLIEAGYSVHTHESSIDVQILS
jgi:hypothetical protein